MTTLRIIGDVHGQTDPDNLFTRNARPYLETISAAGYSIQVGDMGDGETYDQLVSLVDAGRHRFFPGNHDHYDRLPPHSLGDFGTVRWGGVDFFFVRGAASADRDKLVRLGKELGKTLWFAQEELADEQMRVAEQEYSRTKPGWQHARRLGPPNPHAVFHPSRTNDFLARLLGTHAPRLWVFGHHHRDWRCQEDGTLFVCVGELSYIDIDPAGSVCGSQGTMTE
jgi:predicted phosphodiesterase